MALGPRGLESEGSLVFGVAVVEGVHKSALLELFLKSKNKMKLRNNLYKPLHFKVSGFSVMLGSVSNTKLVSFCLIKIKSTLSLSKFELSDFSVLFHPKNC